MLFKQYEVVMEMMQGFKLTLARLPAASKLRREQALTPKAVARLERDTLDRLSGVVIAKLSCNNVVWFGI